MNPSLALQTLGSAPESVNEGVLLIVKSNVTVLSHPDVFVRTTVALLLLDVYVVPSIHVYVSHDVMTSVPVFELVIVKSKVTVLSHPDVFVRTKVALLLLAVYVVPSIHVYESHDVMTSVPVFELVIVKSKVTVLSHPDVFVRTTVALLLLAV